MKKIALSLIATSLFCCAALKADTEKEQVWNSISLQVNTITDRLGMPIDEGVKEAVTALNALGIKTIQSCEGHLDHGLPYPWIDIDMNSDLSRALNLEFEQLAAAAQELLKNYHPELGQNLSPEQESAVMAIYQRNRELQTELERSYLQSIESLYALLNEFYDEHTSSYDQKLYFASVIYNHEGRDMYIRLQNMGGNWHNIRSDEENAVKLAAYQEEIKAFGSFLKEHFFR